MLTERCFSLSSTSSASAHVFDQTKKVEKRERERERERARERCQQEVMELSTWNWGTE